MMAEPASDLIERMRKNAAEILRSHGWTVNSPAGSHEQLDEAMRAAARVMLEEMRDFYTLDVNGYPKNRITHLAVEAFAREHGLQETGDAD